MRHLRRLSESAGIARPRQSPYGKTVKPATRYTSERELSGEPLKIVRPRLVGYGAVLIAMIITLTLATASRPLVSLDFAKDRGLYRLNTQGEIENSYTLKIVNKSHQNKRYNVSVKGFEGLNLIGPAYVNLNPGEQLAFPLSVSVASDALKVDVTEIEFYLTQLGQDDSSLMATSRFTGPLDNHGKY
jgi:polyferredoxin